MLAEANWFTWLESWTSGEFKFVIVVLGGALVAIAWGVAIAWRAVREAEYRTRLTAALLQKGMRGEEIERVLRAAYTPVTTPGSGEMRIDPKDDPEVRIVKHLSSCSYDGGDIDKVLSAAREKLPIDEACVRMVEAMASNWVDADEIGQVIRNRRPARPAPAEESTRAGHVTA